MVVNVMQTVVQAIHAPAPPDLVAPTARLLLLHARTTLAKMAALVSLVVTAVHTFVNVQHVTQVLTVKPTTVAVTKIV